MDYSGHDSSSAQNNTFTSNSLPQPSSSFSPSERKSNPFYSWHEKAGIPPPRNYPLYASRPVPFSSTAHRPPDSAASDYINRISHSQFTASDFDDATGPRDTSRALTVHRWSPKAGQWPRTQFGIRPHQRGRRASSVARERKPRPEEYPPLVSVYDSFTTTPAHVVPSEPVLTPTAVRVENFASDRFPDVIRALRIHGVVLEAYSGLPDSECHLLDPEIYPRDRLDAEVLAMVQPCVGEGWVRITFAVREAAVLAVESAERGEIVVGGFGVRVGWWTEERVEGEVEEPIMGREGEEDFGEVRDSVGGVQQGEVEESAWVRGAARAVAKPVEFAKVDGFWWGLTKAALGGWGVRFGEVFKWVMNEAVGFKHVV